MAASRFRAPKTERPSINPPQPRPRAKVLSDVRGEYPAGRPPFQEGHLQHAAGGAGGRAGGPKGGPQGNRDPQLPPTSVGQGLKHGS